MKRRDFLRKAALGSLATLTGAGLRLDGGEAAPPPLGFRNEKSRLKITGVRPVLLRRRRPLPSYTPAPGSWSTDKVEVANPMSIYPKYKATRSLFMAGDLGPEAVEITTDKGVTGIGVGGPGGSFVIERHLQKLVVGEDPFNIERIWDILWRSTMYYGRKGVVVHAISAIDNALWDLVGKALHGIHHFTAAFTDPSSTCRCSHRISWLVWPSTEFFSQFDRNKERNDSNCRKLLSNV